MDDRLKKITPPCHDELHKVFLVIVVSTIDVDATNPEELLKHVKTLGTFCTLCHHKLMCHLEASLVALSSSSIRPADKVDRKATFSVYKTSDPADLDQSFLLIFRIRRFVTAWFVDSRRVPRNTRVFQHIAKFY